MNNRIFFNRLPASVTEQELTDLFSAHGNIVSVHISADRTGFVTMITPEGARAAILSLNGKVLASSALVLSDVSPKGEPVNLAGGSPGPRRGPSHLY